MNVEIDVSAEPREVRIHVKIDGANGNAGRDPVVGTIEKALEAGRRAAVESLRGMQA